MAHYLPCSLHELMNTISKCLYSYDYRSPRLVNVLATILVIPESQVREMLRILEGEPWKLIRLSWNAEDCVINLEIIKNGQGEAKDFSRLPRSPFMPTLTDEEQAA